MILFGIVVGIYLHMMVTWLFYLAVMNLDRRKDELTWKQKIFTYPILWVGLLLDVSFNLIEGTVMFMELPRETLFTPRCARHIHDPGWRGSVVRFWCHNFLNPYDKSGNHCS